MAFEVYKPRGERAEKAPVVSFSKTSIVLNTVAREKLDSPNIELAYDKDTNTIRIRASEGGMTIKKTKLFGKGFFNQFGISKRGKFKADFKPDERSLYVSLNQ